MKEPARRGSDVERAEALRRTLTQRLGPELRREVNRHRVRLGMRFGRLLVLGPVTTPGQHARWRVVCDCGATKAVCAHHLVQGLVASCGCLRRQMARKTNQERVRLAQVAVAERFPQPPTASRSPG